MSWVMSLFILLQLHGIFGTEWKVKQEQGSVVVVDKNAPKKSQSIDLEDLTVNPYPDVGPDSSHKIPTGSSIYIQENDREGGWEKSWAKYQFVGLVKMSPYGKVMQLKRSSGPKNGQPLTHITNTMLQTKLNEGSAQIQIDDDWLNKDGFGSDKEMNKPLYQQKPKPNLDKLGGGKISQKLSQEIKDYEQMEKKRPKTFPVLTTLVLSREDLKRKYMDRKLAQKSYRAKPVSVETGEMQSDAYSQYFNEYDDQYDNIGHDMNAEQQSNQILLLVFVLIAIIMICCIAVCCGVLIGFGAGYYFADYKQNYKTQSGYGLPSEQQMV